MPECLIKAISTHEGPREPYNWSGYALAEFATVSQGYTFSRDYQGKTDGRWQYFKVADIGLETNGKYLEKAINSIDDETIQLIGCRPFPKGSIVFPRVGAALLNNNKKVLAQDSIVDDNVLVLSIVNPDICDFEYLYYALQQVQLANWCNSSLVPVINSKTVLKHKIVLPPIEEQRRIAEILSTQDRVIELYDRKIEQLQRFKKGMLSKMLPKPGHNTPEVRFPGFTDAWEQRKLGELVQFSKGTGYSKADLKATGTPIILYGRLYTRYETVISDMDTFADARPSSVYSNGGEVIVPASGETAEDISIASVVEKPGVLLGGDLNIIIPPTDLDSAFLAISISNGKPHSDMAKMAQGKSVVHLHNTDLEKIELTFPSFAEQRQISSYYRQLDHLVALHQRKRDEEIRKKKALMLLLLTGKVRVKA